MHVTIVCSHHAVDTAFQPSFFAASTRIPPTLDQPDFRIQRCLDSTSYNYHLEE